MTIIQRREHLAKDFEKLIITGLARDSGPVSFILLFPVDIPYFEKWIPVVKGLPKLFEIRFGVAIEHAIPLWYWLSFISSEIVSRNTVPTFLFVERPESRNAGRHQVTWSAAA